MLRLTLLTILISLSTLTRAGNLWGVDYYAFSIKTNEPVKFENGLFEKTDVLRGHYWGGCYGLPVTRNSAIGFGLGLSKIQYQKEIQGIFPETGLYGFISITGSVNYWSLPISYVITKASSRFRYSYYNGIRLTYVPSFIDNSSTSLNANGGSTQSEQFLAHKNDEVRFQHSLLISFTNQIYLARKIKLCIDPYIGFGSGYFNSEKNIVSNISYGVRLSFQFKLPEISFELDHHTDAKELEKQKLLLQKQKEIEEQLRKKPN